MNSRHIVRQEGITKREQREEHKGHSGFVLWFTGLSGSGKSTLAAAVEQSLMTRLVHTYVLDGDNIRFGLCSDLGFAEADRSENIRRLGEVSALMVDAGLCVLVACISPLQRQRDNARSMVENGHFVEVYMATHIAVCEQRDVKGLYLKARSGQIKGFTGIDDPYDPPLSPELTIDTAVCDLSQSVEQVITYLQRHGLIPM